MKDSETRNAESSWTGTSLLRQTKSRAAANWKTVVLGLTSRSRPLTVPSALDLSQHRPITPELFVSPPKKHKQVQCSLLISNGP